MEPKEKNVWSLIRDHQDYCLRVIPPDPACTIVDCDQSSQEVEIKVEQEDVWSTSGGPQGYPLEIVMFDPGPTQSSIGYPSNNNNKRKITKSKKSIRKLHHLPLDKSNSKIEIKKENSKKKNKGQTYINTRGETIKGKYVKPNPCMGVRCGNNCCNISEEERTEIFHQFWSLSSYQRRKDWIARCAVRKAVKRPNKMAKLNRSQSYEYYLNEGESRRKVCQKFIIATLDVTQRFILYTLDMMVDGSPRRDGRGSAGGRNKTPEDVIVRAKNFIQDLPFMPPHCCERDSERLCLPEDYKSIANLYRIYLEQSAGKTTMSHKVFAVWFRKTFNIRFHLPKKDENTLNAPRKT